MPPPNHVFVARGDITQLCADAVVLSVDAEWSYRHTGLLIPYFEALGRGFPRAWPHASNGATRLAPEEPGLAGGFGETRWFPLAGDHRPFGVLAAVTTPLSGRSVTDDEAEQILGNAVRRAAARLEGDGRREKGRRVLVALPAFWTGTGGERDHLAAPRR
jgi:hypothetical protein